ncbi:4-hydroxy-tetrahydrodipicolinate reductase [Natronomonas pharaonis DSM 2160]|uniref:4-hydroxy-tetrahydrodipicolinate reductase n=1 Tax=Natronomonas pharaonis (strain ATCC 35678 / DSM 2160 / CIP 103997 / JCM 8858 / NBRC 14720 / NCIMB 2260 / Gabara) TaxID=348780 RepID=DAPB_NATPD|nr:4-hydroxy-tetrahydrodipicolinate reductase [Natronomonas pharaonis]Q3ISP9.1 RecName: Full=4-hydroxy-tetrahydrodipicolinate reductase; Short=HTPA reductase [Natronomonas pharaonis DSM 2160]CAI48837.1 4-hydroxy-tetrahydrodipicolinate reductase [Natronomonas pharaonis DSM 2160]
MNVVVVGATGRTGSEIVAEASERGHDVSGVARSQTSVGDVRVYPTEEFPELLDNADAVIDFTVPEATREHVQAAAAAGVPYVIGTTGFDDDGMAALRTASESTAVLKASNFARGVQALLRVVEAGVEALPEYDIELTETHHNGKRDAPSGTANTILDVVDETRDEALDRTHGREGEHRRGDDEVGVHVRRAGTVRGEHELLLAGNDEVLSLTHRAESRRVFAAGAVDAAEWLADRSAGWYDFEDTV